jgi:O-methyltransferase
VTLFTGAPSRARAFFGYDGAGGKFVDLVPRLHELSDLSAYRHGAGLWRVLERGGWTMTSCRRGRTLYRLARQVEATGVPGALVDCGVWNGGSTILLSAGAPSRPAWAFDSFQGLPEPGREDPPESAGWTGECLGSEARLREGFRRFADPERLHVAAGWFDHTFPTSAADVGDVAVLHADGDWYESVQLTLETFYPRVSVGGYVVIDDYGWWEGARRATDKFRREHQITEPLVRVDYTGAYWQRRV